MNQKQKNDVAWKHPGHVASAHGGASEIEEYVTWVRWSGWVKR
jgi:hypothetical protein